MVDLSLFRNVQFSLGLLMGLLTFVVGGGMFILPFFLQLVKGYPTHQVGLMMMISPVMMGLMAPLAGSLSDRFGTRGITLIGLLIVIGGCWSISTLSSDTTVFGYLLRVAPFGLGFGIFQSPNNSAIMGSAPPERLGVASGLLALSRNLGTTTGLPLMGAIFTATALAFMNGATSLDVTTAPSQALVSGVTGTFRFGVFITFFATAMAMFALWQKRRENSSPP
jgi:MFS family permease